MNFYLLLLPVYPNIRVSPPGIKLYPLITIIIFIVLQSRSVTAYAIPNTSKIHGSRNHIYGLYIAEAIFESAVP